MSIPGEAGSDRPDWWLDEAAHAGPEHLDPTYVVGYERKAGVDPAADVATLRAHGLHTESTVLDLGAGTGVFALAVAPSCRSVTAVDVSPAMTAQLRARVSDARVANIDVVEAGFLSFAPPEPFDFVYSRNALHQIPDFWKGIALERMHRWLHPNGILLLRDLVYDFDPAEATERLTAWFAKAVSDPARGWTADELATHVRTEHSTYSWLLEALLAHCGFEILEREYHRAAYATYLCRRTG